MVAAIPQLPQIPLERLPDRSVTIRLFQFHNMQRKIEDTSIDLLMKWYFFVRTKNAKNCSLPITPIALTMLGDFGGVVQ